jgi:hypothetical protein
MNWFSLMYVVLVVTAQADVLAIAGSLFGGMAKA